MADLDVTFETIISLFYWLIVLAWLAVFILLVSNAKLFLKKNPVLSLICAVLAVDAFRSVIENIYFGKFLHPYFGWSTGAILRSGEHPGYLLGIKFLTLASAVILFLLLRRLIPAQQAAAETLAEQRKADAQRAFAKRLEEEHESLTMAQSVAKIGSWEIDVETMIVTWSDENYRIHEVDPASFQPSATTLLDYLSEEDVAIQQRLLEESLATGQPGIFEHRVRLSDGRAKQVEERWRVITDSAGLPKRVIGTCQDITERKQAELALASSEIRLRSIIDNEPECVKLLAADGSLLDMNPAGLRMIEAESIDEVKNHNLYPLVVKEYRHAFRELNQRVFAGGSGKLEFEVVGLKGGRRWLETHASPLHDSAGKITALLGITRDITERKQALEVLEASELQQRNMVRLLEAERARLVAAQRVAKVGSWETDLKSLAVTWSDETHHIHETDPSVFHPTHEDFLALVHPADRHAVEAAFNQSLDQHFDQQHDNVAEHRLLLADGRIKYVEERWQIIFDSDGMAARAVGTCQDVTDRKQAELKIEGLNRVYAVLSHINSLIVRVRDRDELYREACRIAVETGGFRMAMICIVDRASNKVIPVATAGKDDEFLTAIRNILSSDEKAPTTIVAKVIREKMAVVSNDSEGDPRNLLRDYYTRAGVRSLAVLPLMVAGEVVGILALYSKEKNFFHDEEMKQLTDLARDVSFAIDYIGKKERLEHLASFDQVTGLANRRLFLERLAELAHGNTDNGHRFALFLIDLERFKNINDSLGRPVGDVLLQQVAGWLSQQSGGLDRVARIGSDQFAVVLSEEGQTDNVVRQLEAIIEKFLSHPFQLNGDVYRIAAKFGVAMYPDDGTDADILFKNAEAALKKAKAGGYRHLFYTQKMTETVAQRLKLENQLRSAIDNHEFVLHYQPKVNLDSGKVTSVEALIRWNDPLTGLVPPGLFIPILEETGLISEVGRWALHKSLEDFLRWRATGLTAVRIAVNVSPLQFRHPGFIASLQRLVDSDPHAAEALELELTEGIIMDDMQQAIASLQAIREMGMTIAIDDFGTGFSSLGYLSKLPIDTLKIDRMFVTEMVANPRGLSLVSTIINLAHSLQLKVVAEGVETEEQSNLLRLLKCDEMQGYLFSKPVPVDVLERKYLALPGRELIDISEGRAGAQHIAKLEQLRGIVAERGVRAGLIYLNGLSEHRFTALYRFDGDNLHNVVFYDRENLSMTSTESIPVLDSYCVFVRDSDATFNIDCAAEDDRLGDHVKRDEIQSYCGVPLRNDDGTLFGTICHFDFTASRISEENIELMEDIAPVLKEKISGNKYFPEK